MPGYPTSTPTGTRPWGTANYNGLNSNATGADTRGTPAPGYPTKTGQVAAFDGNIAAGAAYGTGTAYGSDRSAPASTATATGTGYNATISTATYMAWRHEQWTAGNVANSNTVSATIGSWGLNPGTKLIAAVNVNNSGTAPTCTGVSDGTNSFTLVDSVAENTGAERLNLSLWVLDVTSDMVGTKPTITATLTNAASAAGAVISVQEVSGLASGTAVDGTAAHSTYTTGNTSLSMPAYSSTAASEYLLAVYADEGVGTTPGTPSGFQGPDNNIPGVDGSLSMAWKNSTGGAESGTWTGINTTAHGAQIVVAFPRATIPTGWVFLQADSNSTGGNTETSVGMTRYPVTAGSKLICLIECTRSCYPGTTSGATDVIIHANSGGSGAGATIAHFTKIVNSLSTNGGSIDNKLEIWVCDTPAAMVGTTWPTYEITAQYVSPCSGSGEALSVLEFTGLATGTGVDGTAGTAQGYAGSIGPPTYASSVAGELLFYGYTDWGSNQNVTRPSGYMLPGQGDGLQVLNSSGIVVPAFKNSTGGTETGVFGNQAANNIRNVAMVAFPLAVVSNDANPPAGNASATGTAYNASVTVGASPRGTKQTVTVTERGRQTPPTLTQGPSFGMTAALVPGMLLTVRVVASNSGAGGNPRTLNNVTDGQNSFVRVGLINNDPGAVDQGVTTWIYRCVVTVPMPAGTPLFLSFGAAPTWVGVVLEEWTGIDVGSPPAADSALTGTSTTTSTAIANITPPGPNGVGDVVVVHNGWGLDAASDTYTGDSDTLEGSWVSMAQAKTQGGVWHSDLQYKVTTGRSQQSHQATLVNAVPSGTLAFTLPANYLDSSHLATGTAYNATVSTACSAQAATASGTAANASISTTAAAGAATGTGVASNASLTIRAAPSAASAAGVASNAAVTTAISAGAATATGTAANASIVTSVSAGAATATGTAYNPAPTRTGTASAGAAVGAGNAYVPGVSASGVVGVATGTTAAYGPSIAGSGSINAGVATGSGNAYGATISTSKSVTAGTGTGTGTAQAPSVSVNVTAQVATAAGTAYAAVLAVKVSVQTATGTASAYSLALIVRPTPTTATGVGVGEAAAVDTGVTGVHGMWNGQEFVQMMYGNKEVIDFVST